MCRAGGPDGDSPFGILGNGHPFIKEYFGLA